MGAAVFGRPLATAHAVIVGTEADDLVAVDRSTGHRLWTVRVGTPLRNVAQVAGCGDIDPLGITSAPVLDTARNEVFAVGEVLDAKRHVEHELIGVDATSGRVELREDADPPLPAGERAVHLLQRAGLAVGSDTVYIAYGGNAGDCGSYHGWIVGVPASGSGPHTSFEVAREGQGGAIWLSGGAPAIAADGTVIVTTGNANPFPARIDAQQYTESVVKLSPGLRVLASFKDRRAAGDEDLATGNPVLLPGGLVFAVGKTDTGYLLRASDLSEVASIHGVCGSDPDGGAGYDAATQRLFVPCRAGSLQVIDVAHRRLGPRLTGSDGAPIIVGRTVWSTKYPDGGLVAYSASSEHRLLTVRTPALPHFATPTASNGRLFLGTDTGVVAYAIG